MSSTLSANDATPRIPPRYWWLRRILLAIGVLVVLLALFRLWWGWEAQRRLDAKIAEYRAAGQPVTLADFQQPAVPDEENAARYLQDAAAAIVVPAGPIVDIGDLCGDLKLVEQIAPEANKLIEANQTALNLARQARSKSLVDWKIPNQSPLVPQATQARMAQRQLARLLCAAATYYHYAGDDRAALQSLQDAFTLAVATRRMANSIISELTADAIEGLAAETLEAIAPGLRIENAVGERSNGPDYASAEDLHGLCDALLDEKPVREAWARSMYAERRIALDILGVAGQGGNIGAMYGVSGSPALGPFGRLLRPMFQADAIFMMEYYAAMADASRAGTFAAARDLTPTYPAFASGIERNVHLLSRISIVSIERALELHFRGIAMRRMATVALALRLYDVEHGRRPADLDDLVPDYLPALPGDPFAPDGRPIGYRPDALRPVLYSVGSDEIDDGGEYALKESGGIDWNAKDLVFFLNGDRPIPPPQSATQPSTTQAVKGEGEEVGDQRQTDENPEVPDGDNG